MKKNIIRIAKVLVILYGIAGIFLYYRQDKLIFHPQEADKKGRYDFGQNAAELNIPYDKESNINIVQFKPAIPPDSQHRTVILYFHGNSETIGNCADIAAAFTAKGHECWVIDYPGYGRSTGPLTEKRLYEYALAFYKLARSRFQPGQIILYGRSIGTGIAAQLASVRDCRRLILESPYYSLNSLARQRIPIFPVSLMLHYHFPTNEYLAKVTAPVTIFHGDDDHTIPYSNAIRLQPLLKSGDKFITIPGAGHNDLYGFPLFRKEQDAALRQ